MRGEPAESAGMLRVAKELRYGAYSGMLELYEQLTTTKVYHTCKTHTNQPNNTLCTLCGKTAESISDLLAS